MQPHGPADCWALRAKADVGQAPFGLLQVAQANSRGRSTCCNILAMLHEQVGKKRSNTGLCAVLHPRLLRRHLMGKAMYGSQRQPERNLLGRAGHRFHVLPQSASLPQTLGLPDYGYLGGKRPIEATSNCHQKSFWVSSRRTYVALVSVYLHSLFSYWTAGFPVGLTSLASQSRLRHPNWIHTALARAAAHQDQTFWKLR